MKNISILYLVVLLNSSVKSEEIQIEFNVDFKDEATLDTLSIKCNAQTSCYIAKTISSNISNSTYLETNHIDLSENTFLELQSILNSTTLANLEGEIVLSFLNNFTQRYIIGPSHVKWKILDGPREGQERINMKVCVLLNSSFDSKILPNEYIFI